MESSIKENIKKFLEITNQKYKEIDQKLIISLPIYTTLEVTFPVDKNISFRPMCGYVSRSTGIWLGCIIDLVLVMTFILNGHNIGEGVIFIFISLIWHTTEILRYIVTENMITRLCNRLD